MKKTTEAIKRVLSRHLDNLGWKILAYGLLCVRVAVIGFVVIFLSELFGTFTVIVGFIIESFILSVIEERKRGGISQ